MQLMLCENMAVELKNYMYLCAVLIFVLWSERCTEGADITYMSNSLRDYFSQARHHDVDQAYKDRSMHFIYDEFSRFGLEAEYHEFQDLRVSDTLNFTNVIGILKGERFGTMEDRILGVGAHFDTVNNTAGVDDNGAGCAAMLEVARQLTDLNKQGIKRQNTIIFVSFDVEERYSFASGSEKYVSEWLLPFLERNYGADYKNMKPHGFVVIDMPMEYNTSEYSQTIIGPKGSETEFSQYFPTVYSNMQASNFKGDFLALSYRNGSVDVGLGEAFKNAWQASERPRFKLESFPLPVLDVKTIETHPILSHFLRSDHTPFWWEDFPAIFFMDTANFRGDGAYCYHRPCDNIEVYLTDDNINFLGKTTDSIAKTLDLLSEPFQDNTSGSASWASRISAMVLSVLLLCFLI